MSVATVATMRGQEPVYVEDEVVETDGELHSLVVLKIDEETEVIVDFTPTQARAFARELIDAADRAVKEAPIEAMP